MLAVGLLGLLAVLVVILVMWLQGREQSPAAFVASLPQERVDLWDELAGCESEGDWSLDSGNGYFGGLQISPTSWKEAEGGGLPHETSRAEQIMRAETILEAQGWAAWPRCSASLGLGS